MTYNEAYNKIIDAYFKDEIKPMDTKFCFCGTLCDNTKVWYGGIVLRLASHGYNGKEFLDMEGALFGGIRKIDGLGWGSKAISEDALFSGMCAALDVLKNIHRERGENVDEVPQFTKRSLSTVG